MSDLITTTPESLIAAAIEKDLDISKLHALMELRREWMAEQAKKLYFEARTAFQAECPVIQKDKIVYDKYGKERYRYAPTDRIVREVKDLLTKNGFSWETKGKQTETSYTAIVVATHVAGHSEYGEFTVPIKGDYMTDQQIVASARSFAERYAFCGVFGIKTSEHDDDGNIFSIEATGLLPEQIDNLYALLAQAKADIGKFCKHMKIGYVAEIKADRYDEAVMKLQAKIQEKEKGGTE